MNSSGKFIYPYWCEVIFYYDQAEPTLTADLLSWFDTRIVYNFDVFSFVAVFQPNVPLQLCLYQHLQIIICSKNSFDLILKINSFDMQLFIT